MTTTNTLQKRKPRKRLSASGGWILTRKVIQGVVLAGFLLLIVLSRSGRASPQLINLPLRLDPLVALSSMIANRAFLAAGALSLLTVLLALVAGRAWCGWLCPLGAVLDLFSFHKKGRVASVPEGWRKVKYVVLLIILFAALIGNLTLLILDPVTLLMRGFTVGVWPAVDRAINAVETMLYPVPFLSKAIVSFDSLVRPALLPTQPVFYQGALLFAALLVGVILLNLVASRFWCRYLCPLGGLLGLIGKVSLFRRQVGEECRVCKLCTAACPTGTIDPAKNYASDPGECTLCLECLDSCPRSSIQLTPGLKPGAWQPYDPSRREALGAFGVSAAAIALFRSEDHIKHANNQLLRPPGATEEGMLSTCVRCGACLADCPTGALQPSMFEAGLEGMWMPLVVARQGYCDYACNACGQVCPVQAIPALSLEEKRQQVIGKAYFDENRCIAWSDHRDCIVCEEMCPLPQKAITLTPTEFVMPDGEKRMVQLPSVDREVCIGCGICENRCPVAGEAAVRVYIPPATENYW